jgi:DUF971 family protein
MAGDRQKFKRCTAKWEELRDEGHFSKPEHLGRVAIICSNNVEVVTCRNIDKPNPKELKIFRKEALRIAEHEEARGRDTEIIFSATTDDIDDVLKDPDISSIVTVGHGNFSSFFVDDDHDEGIYDWRRVSESTDHLKTGYVVQRHCGHFALDLAVPFGIFAAAKHSQVIAPVGEYFEPRGLYHDDNRLLVRVTDQDQLTIEDIKANFKDFED